MSHDPSPDPSSPPGSAPGPALAGLAAGVAADSAEDSATPVVTATLSLAGFIDGWIHCQHVADYLARFAASDRFDPAQLTTRLSTYLNEALELVFRSDSPTPPTPTPQPHTDAPQPAHTLAAAPTGEIVIAIHRLPDRLQVELRCPAASERMRRSVRRAAEADAAATYRRDLPELLHGDPLQAGGAFGDAAADDGLLELVALHGIGLELHETSDAVVLRMTVPHE